MSIPASQIKMYPFLRAQQKCVRVLHILFFCQLAKGSFETKQILQKEEAFDAFIVCSFAVCMVFAVWADCPVSSSCNTHTATLIPSNYSLESASESGNQELLQHPLPPHPHHTHTNLRWLAAGYFR